MRLVLTGEGRTASRALLAVLAGSPHDVVLGDDGHPRLDTAARVVHLADRTVAVVLTTPGPGQVGVVEDLLVDRAFPDVPGEATVLAELGDLLLDTVEDLHEALAAAALARAAGVPAERIRAGLAIVRP